MAKFVGDWKRRFAFPKNFTPFIKVWLKFDGLRIWMRQFRCAAFSIACPLHFH